MNSFPKTISYVIVSCLAVNLLLSVVLLGLTARKRWFVKPTGRTTRYLDIKHSLRNIYYFRNVTTLWYNTSILTGDVTGLKTSSLLYRVNLGEVNKLAVKGKPTDYIPELRNPCWIETHTASNPYNTNPLPAIRQPEFTQFSSQLSSRRDKTRSRCLPYFYLIGVSKAGTTDFFGNLLRHPRIQAPGAKEPTWWNARLGGSANVRFRDYVDLFDVAADKIRRSWDQNNTQTITGEATPSYCYDNDDWTIIPGNRGLSEPRYGVPHVIRYVTPSARIILLLRDPTDRVYSHFRNVRPRDPADVFHRHVTRGLALMETCLRNRTVRSCFYDPRLNRQILPLHLRASMYPVILHDWLTVFPRSHVIVVKAEDYFRDRVTSLDRVFRFLGIDALDAPLAAAINSSRVKNDRRDRGSSGERMRPETRRLLDQFFVPFNNRLRELGVLDGQTLWGK